MLSVKGEIGRSSSTELQRKVQQVEASWFDRLYSLMDGEGLIQPLAAFDDDIYRSLGAGEIIEAPVIVRLTGLQQMLDLAADFMDKWVPMLKLGNAGPQVSDETANATKMAEALRGILEQGPLAVIATATGNPRIRFVCRLDRRFLRIAASSVEGEATLLAKIQRKLKDGETVSAVEMPGFGPLSGQARSEFDSIFQNPNIEGIQLGESSITSPGAVVTVIGLYR